MKYLLTIFVLLLALSACDVGRSSEMDVVLDRADSMNRAYIPMTDGIDSLLHEATQYYDRHGTPNQQMRAHYLLGCAYRDMGEAPAALQSYQDAVDRADTLSSDCDYRRLMSVYGQMAELFHAQNLPEDELDAYSHCKICAEHLNDTLLIIRCLELKAKPYFLLHDTFSMIDVLQRAQRFYIKHGYSQEAASIYPPIIDISLSQDSLVKAKRLMDIFETKSNLFDTKGNISTGREDYYDIKGIYYNKVHNIDSAEYYFRKMLESGLNTNAYKGLLFVYKNRMNIDSIMKYARLYEKSINDEQDSLRTQTIHQMSSMYNYQRFLKKADTENRRAERFSFYLLISIFSIILLIMIAVAVGYILFQKKRRQEEETEKIRKNYNEAIKKKAQLSKEMDILRSNYDQLIVSEHETKSKLETVSASYSQLICSKEKEIACLNQRINDYAKRLVHSDKIVGKSLQFTLLIEDFHKKAERKKTTLLPTRLEWDQFLRYFTQTQPKAYAAIGREQTLSPKELKACILLLMKFTNSEVIALLDISSQSLTNVKTRINEKLFGVSNASTLEAKIKDIPIV